MAAPSWVRLSGPGNMATFNMNDGYMEGLLRGLVSGLLKQQDYSTLTQCDTLDDLKLQIGSTDYGDFLADVPSPLHTTTIAERATAKMVKEWTLLRYQAAEPLATFLDFISYAFMIDNAVLIITGTLHERDIKELIEKCHPLGMFDALASLSSAINASDLYDFLSGSPLGNYIQGNLKESDLDEMNIEILRNTLYKAYLEDFYAFCQKLGGATFDIMSEILKFEADRRSINITLNAFGTELVKEDREQLYPQLGHLFPEGHSKFSKCSDAEDVRASMETYSTYKTIFASTGGHAEKSLEDSFYEYEVHLNELSFMTQFGYGAFYSYFKLKEQEIRNIVWIAECIQQEQKDKVDQYISIFAD